MLEALLLAVVFIYLILASLFGSFLQPLAIMLALPLSFLGVALALLVTEGTLNVMSMIGIIMLMGLVTKNGILLIDFVNKERERGCGPARRRSSTSARIRLRPIIMTTFAMIFGMLPLALAIGEGAEQRAPMAHAVIGGSDHVDAADAVRRAGGVHAAGRPGNSGPRQEAGEEGRRADARLRGLNRAIAAETRGAPTTQ